MSKIEPGTLIATNSGLYCVEKITKQRLYVRSVRAINAYSDVLALPKSPTVNGYRNRYIESGVSVVIIPSEADFEAMLRTYAAGKVAVEEARSAYVLADRENRAAVVRAGCGVIATINTGSMS